MAAVAAMLTILLAATLPAGAKLHYRGFVEGGIGVNIVSGSDQSNLESTGGGAALGYVFATTHGIQLQKNFIGIGFGITPAYWAIGKTSPDNTEYDYDLGRLSNLSFPVYAAWRYDFFGQSIFNQDVWNPYIGAKIGLFLPIGSTKEVKYMYNGYSGWRSESEQWLGELGYYCPIYIALDFGLRKKISSTSGISLGLTLQSSANGQGLSFWSEPDGQFGLSILAKVGIDF